MLKTYLYVLAIGALSRNFSQDLRFVSYCAAVGWVATTPGPLIQPYTVRSD